MCAKSLQWCLTLCNPMDCNPTASSCPWVSPGKTTGVGLPFPSPGDLPNPGIKPTSSVYILWQLLANISSVSECLSQLRLPKQNMKLGRL